MKAILIPAAAFAAAALAGPPAFAQNPSLPPAYRHEHEHDDHGHGRPADQTQVVRQRVDAVADQLENVQEHLEDDLHEGHADRATVQLFRQADTALREAMHFHDDVRPGTPPRELYEHFRVLDRQVHGLLEAMRTTDDRVLRRAASRLAFADEQLHAAVAPAAGPLPADFIARQAHVLADEAVALERAARATVAQQDHDDRGDHRGDRELLDALHVFADRVEHFHETAEEEHDAEHLAVDFARVDQSWQQVVELLNRNPHGLYLSRRAQRVGAMHDDLSRVIGVKRERRTIRFNLGGIGINVRP